MEDLAKPYMDYLDKEMTIMGVLSAFCVLVAGGVLDRTAGAARDTALFDLWRTAQTFLLVGSLLLILAALMFYAQRSHLAWYLGEISLALARGKDPGDLLQNADSWATWIRYRVAFALLGVGLVEYILAYLKYVGPSAISSGTWTHTTALSLTPVAIAAVVYVPWMLVLWRFGWAEEPLREFFKRLRQKA